MRALLVWLAAGIAGAWQTVEPAIDFDAAAAFAFALSAVP
jgi:hypothetical protein